MKALSLRQPWAWLVLHGKDIENRRWKIAHRGPFLIHASKGMTTKEWREAVDFTRQYVDAELAARIPGRDDLVFGALVGRSAIEGCLAPLEQPTRRWHMPQQWGALLVDTHEIDPVPCKGALGFFDVPAELLAQIRRTDPSALPSARGQALLF